MAPSPGHCDEVRCASEPGPLDALCRDSRAAPETPVYRSAFQEPGEPRRDQSGKWVVAEA